MQKESQLVGYILNGIGYVTEGKIKETKNRIRRWILLLIISRKEARMTK